MRWLYFSTFFSILPVWARAQVNTLEVLPFCTPDSFSIQASVTFAGPPGPSEGYVLKQHGQVCSFSRSGRFSLFPNPQWEGNGFTVCFQSPFLTMESPPFQILGKPVNANIAPEYIGLVIDRLAFVHSNIRLTGPCEVKPGARVFNRGQFGNANFDGSNNPTADEVKWTVDGKNGTSLRLGKNSHVTAACDRMWQGIQMLGSQSDPIFFYMDSAATLSHAFKALQLPLESGKVRILAKEGSFSDNFISVEIFQNNTQGSEIDNCVFRSANQLRAPFTGNAANPITSRIGINLLRGIGSQNTSFLKIRNSRFENLFIGIQSLSSRFEATGCRFSGFRFKGINLEDGPAVDPQPLISGCTFAFTEHPHWGWARETEAYCCGNQNRIPGLDPQQGGLTSYMDKGLYGICDKYGSAQIKSDTFIQTVNFPYNRPTFGVIEPAASQARTGNVFSGLDFGLVAVSSTPGPTPYSITGNAFIDNETAIFLARDTVHLALKCNTFVNNVDSLDPEFRRGLVIGEGVRFRYIQNGFPVNNSIGGPAEFLSGAAYPNANVWPTGQVNRGVRKRVGLIEQDLHNPTLGWPNSPNWVAIENQSNTQIVYRRYNNEFVGWGPAILGNVEFLYPNQTNLKIATAGDSVVAGTQGYDFACANFDDSLVVLFPARVAVVTSTLPMGKRDPFHEVFLGNAKPNPAQTETRINLVLPVAVEQATLQVLELSTGRILQTIALRERGELDVYLNTQLAPSGTYTYRLICDGKPMGSGKFVVVK